MTDASRRFAGALLLPLRLVASWLLLSAVHRRFVLAPGKHTFQSENWLGHKINTFFPHANTPFYEGLDFFLRRPVWLDVFGYVFTFTELIIGLLLLLGLFSRLTGAMLVGLSVGLMHTAGWLGPTCLDEWQIASLLVTTGAMLAAYGTGGFSADAWLRARYPSLPDRPLGRWLAYPAYDLTSPFFRRLTVGLTAVLVVYVMGMNQVHHGGLWGSLHNYSKKPDIQLSDLTVHDDRHFSVTAFRDKGPEAYGTFVIQARLQTAEDSVVHRFDADDLSKMSPDAIENVYVNKIAPDEHSLELPLGAKGTVHFRLPPGTQLEPDARYTVSMTEAGGRTYTTTSSPTEASGSPRDAGR